MYSLPIRLLFIAMFSCATVGVTSSTGEVINFDDRPAGTYSAFAYAPEPFPSTGVTFHSADIPDVLEVGSQFTSINNVYTFDIAAGEGGLGFVSSPNFAVATYGGTKDMMMSFPEWVTSLSIRLDTAPEGTSGEIVRLIALKELGPATFEVMQIDEAYDHEPGKLMQLNPGTAFQWAVFQTTTEQEGFDDLTYTVFTKGDMNNDGVVNNQDIVWFVLALTNPEAYATIYPEVNLLAVGRLNGDDLFDNQDIAPFVTMLTGGGTSLSAGDLVIINAIPEPATLGLLMVGSMMFLGLRGGRLNA